ncbi:MAG TPA: DUF58 domain-containing protein [Polyangiales bacterium]
MSEAAKSSASELTAPAERAVPGAAAGRAAPTAKQTRALRREQPWRRHLRTTREGKAFVMVTLGVGVAAFNTGNNLLFLILGFMLSLIVLSGVMSETAIRGLRVSRHLPQRAFAGKVSLVEIVLRNKKPRSPSYSLEIEDIAEDAPTERRCYFLKVAPNAEQAAAYRRKPLRRGLMRFVGFRVATRYPFGIFEKWRMLQVPGELLVYPALLGERYTERDMSVSGVDSPSNKLGAGTEIAGLRGYEVGDDARAIHWKRTASLGKLVVMERQSDAAAQLSILLDNARPRDADATFAARLEYAISEAATLALGSLGRGLSVEVIARGGRSPLVLASSAADPILRYLALLEAVDAEQAAGFGTHARSARVARISVPRAAGGA